MDGALLARLLFCCLMILTISSAALSRSALFYEADESPFGVGLRESMQRLGFEIRLAESNTLAGRLPSGPDLLVLPDARRIPYDSIAPLEQFLRAGGCMLAIGSPLGEEILVKPQDKWLTATQARLEFAKRPPEHLLFEFKPGDEKAWSRGSRNMEIEERLSVYEGALASFIAELDGWNTYRSPKLETPFPPGCQMTVFEARGDANTPSLYVEWREKDGSRWIANVRLSERWKRYVLAPSDFAYWSHSTAVGRGGPDDAFNPANAAEFWIGLAENFGPLPRGRHIWWVRDIGTSPDPLSGQRIALPSWETFAPHYKTYPMRDVHSLQARSDQAVVSAFHVDAHIDGRMPVWRPRGLGSAAGQTPPSRFIPVADAFDHNGEWLGTGAWLLLHFDGDYAGGIWAGIGVDVRNLKRDQWTPFVKLASEMAERMFSGPFIASAGIDRFAVPASGSLAAGCRIVNPHGPPLKVASQALLVHKGKKDVLADHPPVEVAPKTHHLWEAEPDAYDIEAAPARLVTVLSAGEKVIDTISQPLSVVAEPVPPAYVAVRGGQFVLNGEPFYANGINYFPRCALARESGLLSWLTPGHYDPEVIERDLQVLESLNVNLVSIQYTDPDCAPQLIDFLERCRHHRILAHIYLAGAHPLTPDLGKVRSLIEDARLFENPQVFAYDLAWEPVFGDEQQRARYNGEWQTWVIEQYGSIERAERDWGIAGNRDSSGPLSGPGNHQLSDDGDWRVMVAAYRRFADDVISRGYGRVARFIRELDPNHLLCARTGYGGTGSRSVVEKMPFDLASGAAHLDFTSPEGYGLTGELDRYLEAGFTTEYGRMVSGGAPVFWAEFGISVWPRSYDERTLTSQAQHYDKNYELFARSHANGSAAWWFPGGYRVGENSDYGVIEQDARPRPAAEAMSRWAARLHESLKLPPPDGYITIDRDTHVDGYAGVWEHGREEYLQALKRGNRLALRTEGTGTDSRNCPNVAVGGGTWTGDNPPKHLNAEFGRIQFRSRNGQWTELEEGASIQREGVLVISAEVVNSGEARWLPGNETGSVMLQALSGSWTYQASIDGAVDPLDSCPALHIEIPTDISSGVLELRMLCEGRGPFGQKLTVKLGSADG